MGSLVNRTHTKSIVENIIKSNLDIIEDLIDQGIKEEFPNIGVVYISKYLNITPDTLKKYLKNIDIDIFNKLQHLSKLNISVKRKSRTKEKISQILNLSAQGKGVDTIGTLVGISSYEITSILKKELGEEEYRKRHYVGRKGGRFGKEYTLPNGEVVQSLIEYKIGLMLLDANIEFETQKPLQHMVNKKFITKFVDFYISSYDLYIEYAGMMDFKFYRKQVEKKIILYRQLGINYLYIYSLNEAEELIKFLIINDRKEIIEDKLSTLTIPLSHDKVFKTLQCEGPSVGKPSVFIRLSYCNLSCKWCDSFYTWKPEYVNSLEKPFFENLTRIFNDLNLVQTNHNNCFRVVITGGEPLLFQDALQYFVFKSLINGYDVEIETNGTIKPNSFLSTFCSFNVSPKLSNNMSDEPNKRIVPEVINSFVRNKKAIFKFVVHKEEDWEEIKRDYLIPCHIPLNRVWLMPEGQTQEQLALKREFIADLCIKNGVNYSDRLQIITWGTKRGV